MVIQSTINPKRHRSMFPLDPQRMQQSYHFITHSSPSSLSHPSITPSPPHSTTTILSPHHLHTTHPHSVHDLLRYDNGRMFTYTRPSQKTLIQRTLNVGSVEHVRSSSCVHGPLVRSRNAFVFPCDTTVCCCMVDDVGARLGCVRPDDLVDLCWTCVNASPVLQRRKMRASASSK